MGPLHPELQASRFLGLSGQNKSKSDKMQNSSLSSRAGAWPTHKHLGWGAKPLSATQGSGLALMHSQLQLSLAGPQVTTALPASIATKLHLFTSVKVS